MFKLRRMGWFKPHVDRLPPRCGPIDREDRKLFRYDAWVSVSDDGLDTDRFILDNKVISDWFQDYENSFRVFNSCEAICEQAAEIFLRELGPRRRFATEVCVRIWGLPGKAYAEYMWHPKEDKKNGKKTEKLPSRTGSGRRERRTDRPRQRARLQVR